MPTLPVAIMSFDRFNYLEGVLQTLEAQVLPAGLDLEVMLFQDGGVVPGAEPVADLAALATSVGVFRSYFPTGRVFTSLENLGVAKNFDRAERYLFETRKFDGALFLEDDMILSPYYVDTIMRLLDVAMETGYVGMVTAYGFRPGTPMDVQRGRQRELCLMNEHNWAFGITRDCWLRRDEIVREYLEIIDDLPYRERMQKRVEIDAFLAKFGRGGRGYVSSQDSVKNMAVEVLGIHRVSTWTNNARYIGRKGLHMTADRFARRGYDQTVMYVERHDGFDVPPAAALDALRVLA